MLGRRFRAILRRPWIVVGAVALVSVLLNTDFAAPPRYDGAGYAILAEAIRTGRGYLGIDHPDAPFHTHFPPGYPLALAAVWSLTGRSEASAHLFSVACTVGAVLLTWRWLRRFAPSRAGFWLGLALAVNWSWGRVGGSIQSEPLFLLLIAGALNLSGSQVLSKPRAIGIGVLLGAAILTRHVGVCVAMAVVLDLYPKKRPMAAIVVTITAALVVTPWVAWLATTPGETQAGLFQGANLASRVAEQTTFYARRIPDLVIGPVVERATIFGRSSRSAGLATFAAVVASSVCLVGWTCAMRSRRRRSAALVAFSTLPLLLVWPFTEAGRFLIPLLPSVLVGASEGVARLTIGLFRLRNPVLRRNAFGTAAALLFAVSLPYSLYGIATNRAEAQRRTHADFDAACRWIARNGKSVGPVVSRHPGDVYWLTGRSAVAPEGESSEAVEALIQRRNAAYLLVDDERYARAATSPLGVFAERHPERVKLVRDGPTRVFEVIRR